MLKVGVIGAGRMGRHHARVLSRCPDTEVAVVIDVDPLRAELLASGFGCRASTRLEDACSCDAAVVATPPGDHLEVALPLLEAGIPLLVEKPLSEDLREARAIVEASRSRRVPLACGFVERYNPVVLAAARLMEDAGPALHLVGLRHSPPDPVVATSVVHDLLIHDIDLALRMCAGGWAVEVAGGLWRGGPRGGVEIADCVLVTDAGAMATLSASRMGQRKVRRLELSTPAGQMELDLLRRTITVYRHVTHEAAEGGTYRAETVMDIPFVQEAGEPLALQLSHFVALVRGEVDPDAEREGLLPPHEVATRVQQDALGARDAVALA